MKELTEQVWRDVKKVVSFVLNCYPGYEDAVHWSEGTKAEDHGFYRAAQRLNKELALGIEEEP